MMGFILGLGDSPSCHCQQRLVGTHAEFCRTWTVVFVLFIIAVSLGHASGQHSSGHGLDQTASNSTQEYMRKLIDKFGSNDRLNLTQLQTLINSVRSGGEWIVSENHRLSSGSYAHRTSSSAHRSTIQCLSAEDIYILQGVQQNASLGLEDMVRIAPSVLYAAHQGAVCLNPSNSTSPSSHTRPSTTAMWGYGFLLVTLINLCSLMGIVVLPIMQSRLYKVILAFMVALGVGSLCGSSLFFLIPEAFQLYASEDSAVVQSNVYTAVTIIGGIYLFFLTERIMKMVMFYRDKNRSRLDVNINIVPESQEPEIYCSISRKSAPSDNSKCTVPLYELPPALCRSRNLHEEGSGDATTVEDVNLEEEETLTGKSRNVKVHSDHNEMANGHSHLEKEGTQHIASLAWMIICGDGMHNFIDGLSIGAAFSESILAGVSVSLAVICEEIPHELGDFAILLNSGMSLGRALMFNFLSACMCYLGWILGTVLGENTSSHHWVFAVAGGMFLYISLVDMMPEMNSMAQSEEGRQLGQMKVFLLQNLGMLSGLGIMLILAVYGPTMTFE